MLRRVAIHHPPFAVLQLPGAHAHIERHRVTAELVHRDVHAGAGAERRVEEDEARRLAGEVGPEGPLLEVERPLKELLRRVER